MNLYPSMGNGCFPRKVRVRVKNRAVDEHLKGMTYRRWRYEIAFRSSFPLGFAAAAGRL